MTIRPSGVIRLFSKEYLTRKTIPRKRAKPPSQANSFTPMNASQLNDGVAGAGEDGIEGTTGEGTAFSDGGIGGGVVNSGDGGIGIFWGTAGRGAVSPIFFSNEATRADSASIAF